MKEKYDIPYIILEQLNAFAETEPSFLPLFSNAAAVLYLTLEDINWAGFYLMQGEDLVLGPFQGKPACIRIPKGKGVCGKAVQDDCVQRVDDVHDFPGHIACDEASRSEIVIPIHNDGRLIGVLDIDSPLKSRFGAEEEKLLLQFVAVLEEKADFTQSFDWNSV